MKKRILLLAAVLLLTLSMCISAEAESAKLPAFPGAVGGAKYATGARGNDNIEVFHVTNLNESGEGSFADAVSKPGRIIVFDVGGTIKINGKLSIRNNNLTILGQTAPGDGITFLGGFIEFNDRTENVIMRHIRIRPTDINGGEPDGIGGRYNSNIMIDHCSSSWCVDELLSVYAGSVEDGKNPKGNHLTMQNTIGSESLKMSSHEKGAHGYGAIWGGTKASYYANLLAHHDSRSPRLDRELEGTEAVNNVIYNWGQTNSAYGGEPYSNSYGTEPPPTGLDITQNPSYINWVGNYYKYGPATKATLRSRIFDVSNEQKVSPYSEFYFKDNYVSDYPDVTADNSKGINNSQYAVLRSEPVSMSDENGDYSIEAMSAVEAYEYVLNNSGATLPKRDATDARVINDVKNGTGRIINNANEVSGLVPTETVSRKFEIPVQWLKDNNFLGMSETDIITSGEYAGYTVIEAYVNEWTAEQEKNPPTNPNIIVKSPAIAALSNNIDGEQINNGNWTVTTTQDGVDYKAVAKAQGGYDITKTELYDQNTRLMSFDSAEIDTHLTLDEGVHYLTSRAYNTRGETSASTTAIVYVKSTESPGSYKHTQIGSVTFNGLGGASMNSDGVYTISGSGRLSSDKNDISSDSCDFMYKEVSGDFDISVKADEIPKFENQQVSGLMARTSLSANSVMAMIGDGWVKNGENTRVISRAKDGAKSATTYFKTADGKDCANSSKTYYTAKFTRIKREGNKLTFYASDNAQDWESGTMKPVSITFSNLPNTMYVGLATDSAKGISTKEYFSMAKFSRLTLNGETDVEFDDYKVPFYDTRFDSAAWALVEGVSFETNHLQNPAAGNNGYLLEAWGTAKRSFNAQGSGIVNISADYLDVGDSRVDARSGTRFKFDGTTAIGSTEQIISLYLTQKNGIFINWDDENVSVPTADPISTASVNAQTWYKIEAEFNYSSGQGKLSVKPYSVYDSQSGSYITDRAVFEHEFGFDTNTAVNCLYLQRFGGSIKYFDNVSVSAAVSSLYINDGGMIAAEVYSRGSAFVYVVEYDDNGFVSNAQKIPAPGGQVTTVSIPGGASRVKAFLWDENQQPLCSPLTVR